MTVLFSIVLPIFALTGAGWLVRRLGLMGPAAARELNLFVVYLGMPALLFRIMAGVRWADLARPDFIAAFGLGSVIIFTLALLLHRRRGLAIPDAVLAGLNSGYANVGFIGFPLCLAAFGPSSLPLVTITVILTVSGLFGLAVLLVETGLQHQDGLLVALRRVALNLAKNPMLAAPLLGALLAATGIALPSGAERFLTLLGDAATPCALVSLGLFIADTRMQAAWRDLVPLVGLKLVGQPAVTWLLARQVFHLTPSLTAVAVVVAALPTGTGSFILAGVYGRDATLTAGSIMVSTILSVASISALVAIFAQ